MEIRRIDVYAVRYHHASGPFAMSGGRVSTEQDGTVVRLETDDGLVGWGEQCVISPSYAAGYAPTTRAVLGLLAPALLGADPRQTDVAYARLDEATKGYRYAKSALDRPAGTSWAVRPACPSPISSAGPTRRSSRSTRASASRRPKRCGSAA
ncbi:MAG TPA: hypothetical protein VH305_09140 [Gaiella sp.]|jgi:L-alanine-DL-glutamate epimerase-like enolase superfamily enzyme